MRRAGRGGTVSAKECSNCEGEGKVTRWGAYGHEVPATRRYYYPNDKPDVTKDGDGEARPCIVCGGIGYREEEW
jgi:hypothetical protein